MYFKMCSSESLKQSLCVLCKYSMKFSFYYYYCITVKHQFPVGQMRAAVSASQKCCEGKGHDLFHIEHMGQCLVLN